MRLRPYFSRKSRTGLARTRWALPLLPTCAALALLLSGPFHSGIESLRGAELEAAAAAEKHEIEEEAVWVVGIPTKYDRGPVRPFEVRSRKGSLELYPCADCHEDEPANPRERKLTEEHEKMVLDHGGERFWCLTCHGAKDKNTLSSQKGRPIDFDQSYLLCGQCHFQRQKDWFYGGHGKRLSGWGSPRRLAICTECHDSHSPSIKPFKPKPVPLVRKGLVRRKFRADLHLKPWAVRVPNDAKQKGGQ